MPVVDDPDTWFAHTLLLPAPSMLPAIAVPLARMDADEAAELWAAWREYAPTAHDAEKAARLASILRRGVETAVCTTYANVAWVAVGEDEPDGIAESVWELLLNETSLTASVIRLFVRAGESPVVVHMVQRRGERVPKDERGPFRLP